MIMHTPLIVHNSTPHICTLVEITDGIKVEHFDRSDLVRFPILFARSIRKGGNNREEYTLDESGVRIIDHRALRAHSSITHFGIKED